MSFDAFSRLIWSSVVTALTLSVISVGAEKKRRKKKKKKRTVYFRVFSCQRPHVGPKTVYFRVFFFQKNLKCYDVRPCSQLARKHIWCFYMPGFTFPTKPSLHPDWRWVPTASPSGGAYMYFPMAGAKKLNEGGPDSPNKGKGKKGRGKSASPSSTTTGSPKGKGKGLKKSEESAEEAAPAGERPCEKGDGETKGDRVKGAGGKSKGKGKAKGAATKGGKQSKKGQTQSPEKASQASESPVSGKGVSSKSPKGKTEHGSPKTGKGKAASPGSTTGSPKGKGTKGCDSDDAGIARAGSKGGEGNQSILRRANHVQEEPGKDSIQNGDKALYCCLKHMFIAFCNALYVSGELYLHVFELPAITRS